MTKILNLTLVFILLFHVWIAASFELSHDEAYYWLYSHHLDWGYFDHPPAVGLIIRAFSFLPHSELAVRIGFILLQLLSCVLLIRAVPKNRQLVAASLFFAFPLASFAGLLALPDLPLLFMTTLYCLWLKRYLEKNDAVSVLGLALTIPLLLYSKYHGILVVLFTLVALPKLFARKSFYVVTAAALLIFLPHLLWQYDHDFSTLRYHFFERPKAGFSLKRLLEYSVTQVFLAGLFAGPVVWWVVFKTKTQDEFSRALKCISVGTVFFFLISTLSKKFEANWTIFLAAPLILLVVQSALWEKKWVVRTLAVSVTIVMLVRILFVLDPAKVPVKRLREFSGWARWTKEMERKCAQPILANTYQMASKFSFYLNKPVHALNYQSRKNQFDYWPRDREYYPTEEVCYITDKKQFLGEPIVTPEGKAMILVRGFKPSELKVYSP